MFAFPNLFARRKHSPVQEEEAAALPPTPSEQQESNTTILPPLAMAETRLHGEWSAPVTPDADPEREATIEKWREVARQAPNFARAHLRLGIALQENGQWDEAIPPLQRAVRLGKDAGLSSTNCALASTALGCALNAQGSYETSLPVFEQAIQCLNTMPDLSPVGLTEGLRLLQEKQYAGAAAALRGALELGADDGMFGTDPALAQCALGCALAALQDRAGADRAFLESFHLLRQYMV